MKQLIQRLLFVFAVLLPMAVWSQETVKTLGGIKYTLEEDSWVVTGYDQEQFNDNAEGVIEIFSSIEDDQEVDHQVQKIRANAFEGITGVSRLRIYADFETVEDQAFAGLGTEGDPMRLEMDFNRLFNLDFSVTNGVCQLAGGYFECMQNEGSPGFSITYKLTKKPERNGEDMIPGEFWLTNVVQHQGNDSYYLNIYDDRWYGNDELKLAGIVDDALDGIGSIQEPMALEMNAFILKQLGGTYADGVVFLKGGIFQLKRFEDNNGIRVTYAYSKSNEGKDEYVVTKVEKSPDNWGEGFTDYQLRIYTRQDGANNPQTGEWEYIPVTTFKDGAITDEAKGLIKLIYIDGTDLTTVEENAFAGLGTTENLLPFQGSSPVALATKLGGTYSNGVLNLQGGLFVISKTENYKGIHVTYAYSKSSEGKDEYVVTKVEKSPDNWGEGFTDYQLRIYTQQDVEWNEETHQDDYIPVTTFKANVITDEAKGLIKSVRIDGTDLTTVEEDAFAGLGTAEVPLPFQGSSPVALATALGGTYTNGVLNICGGLFVITKTEDNSGIRVTYAYSKSTEGKDEYVVTKVEKSPDWGEGFTDYQLQINTQQDGHNNPQTEEWEYVPVTTFKDGAITDEAKGLIKLVYIDGTDLTTVEENAFAGLGTTENLLPFQGSSPVALATKLGGTYSNGVLNLQGGLFVITKTDDDYGIRVTYAYSKSNEGKDEYVVTKVEKSPDNWGEGFTDYQLRIYTRQDVEWNEETHQDDYIPVTTFKDGAITDPVKGLIKSVRIDGTDLTTVEENAFAGLGTAEAPLPFQGSSPVALATKLGGTYSNGVLNLQGGLFVITKTENYNGIRVTYAYSKSNEGKDEYVVTKVEKSPYDWDEDYQMYIETRQDVEWNEETHQDDYIPVTTFKANAITNEAKALIKSVYIDGTDLTTVEENAFAGLGTAEVPLPFQGSSPVALATALGGTYTNGVLGIGGGLFVISKTLDNNGIRVTYAYSKSSEGKDEYVVTKVEKSPYDWDEDYQMYIETRQDRVWNDEKEQYDYIPVTTFKAGAITDEAKGLIMSVYFEGSDLTTVEADAFAGLGSAESPLPFQGSSPVALATALGGTYTNGVLNIGGGLFVITKTEDNNGIRVTYAYNKSTEGKDEYVVSKVEKSPDNWGEGFTDYQLRIYTQQDEERNPQTGEWEYIPVTTFKANAITNEAKALIKSVYIDGTDLTTVEENAFAGLGTAESPLPLQGNSPVGLAKSLNLTFTDGVASIGGGFFAISRQNGLINYLLDGEEYIAASYDQAQVDYCLANNQPVELNINSSLGEWDAEGNYKSYSVTKIKAGAFNGIQGVTKVTMNGNNLTSIGENAFGGIGADQPINLEMPVQTFKRLGGRFANGQGQLAGGLFVMARQTDDYRVAVTYAYSEDGEGNSEYIVTKIEESQKDWWGESDPYRLTIYSSWEDGRDEITGNWINTPVTTISATALDPTLATKISMVSIYDNNLRTIENDAFAGIGTVDNPAMLEISSTLLASLNPTTEGGATLLRGGYFRTAKTYWPGDGFQDAIFYGDGDGYMLTEPIVAYSDEEEYNLRLPTILYDDNDDDLQYPVTHMAKSAFDGIRNLDINSVTIDGENLQMTLDADAFEGFGAQTPINLGISISLFEALGGTITDGVATLAGGRFYLVQMTGNNGLRTYYTYQKPVDGDGEYVVSNVEKAPYYGTGYYNFRITIESDFYGTPVTAIKAGAVSAEVKALALKSVQIYGKNLKSVDENEFEGIGTSESPVNLTIQPEVFSALGGSVEDGFVKLAGGYFMTDAIATVTTAPIAAEGLEFTGEPQALLTAAGVAENGVIYYYVEQTEQTSEDLPMATNAGTYTIGYYAKGTNGYLDSEWYKIDVTIAPKVREDVGSTEVEQISPTQYNVTIDETSGTPTPIDNDLLDTDGSIMVYDLSFIRDLNATGEPYTLCLPCEPPTGDAIYYTLTNVVNNSELVFEEVANPLADTPYLVVPTTNTSLNKNLNNVKLLKDCGNSQSVGNFTMKGTQTGLTNAEAVAEGAYILQSGNVWKRVATGDIHIPAFRAYIVATGAAPARLTSTVGDATAIDTIRTIDQDGTERWYDMNGHRIAQPTKKGVYIYNNKKVIKK